MGLAAGDNDGRIIGAKSTMAALAIFPHLEWPVIDGERVSRVITILT